MKTKTALLISALFLIMAALPCFAAAPPADPPAKPPQTNLSNMIGTWKGTVNVASESGYSSYTMTLKITDQSNGLFRGYVSDAEGNWRFIAGFHNTDNTFHMVTQGAVWAGEMWWEGTKPTFEIYSTHDDTVAVTTGMLMKTTR
jgi:hypothetical protein